MQYLITFLEGVVSFLSPCMLPLLPVYISYFAAKPDEEESGGRAFARAACFVAGFTAVFCLLGLFAGTLGALLARYRTAVNIVCGMAMALFGLGYLGVFRLPSFGGGRGKREVNGLVSAFLFGMVYSVTLTPCVGAFLGSALLLASASGTAAQGVLLLAAYSLGLGLPFLLSALLLEQLGGAFRFIKKHYAAVNLACGLFLIAVGLLTATGLLGKLLAAFG